MSHDRVLNNSNCTNSVFYHQPVLPLASNMNRRRVSTASLFLDACEYALRLDRYGPGLKPAVVASVKHASMKQQDIWVEAGTSLCYAFVAAEMHWLIPASFHTSHATTLVRKTLMLKGGLERVARTMCPKDGFGDLSPAQFLYAYVGCLYIELAFCILSPPPQTMSMTAMGLRFSSTADTKRIDNGRATGLSPTAPTATISIREEFCWEACISAAAFLLHYHDRFSHWSPSPLPIAVLRNARGLGIVAGTTSTGDAVVGPVPFCGESGWGCTALEIRNGAAVFETATATETEGTHIDRDSWSGKRLLSFQHSVSLRESVFWEMGYDTACRPADLEIVPCTGGKLRTLNAVTTRIGRGRAGLWIFPCVCVAPGALDEATSTVGR
ncbi:hypothetical protein C8R46DRAFT_1216577 [Mycena filopes]|nr:hypothetical protein C8R46DRAFT_1216577 [Mycena filopes]